MGSRSLRNSSSHQGFAQREVLALVASLERYSKHPLARAILSAAQGEGSSSRRLRR
jgi:cation transport ATPase